MYVIRGSFQHRWYEKGVIFSHIWIFHTFHTRVKDNCKLCSECLNVGKRFWVPDGIQTHDLQHICTLYCLSALTTELQRNSWPTMPFLLNSVIFAFTYSSNPVNAAINGPQSSGHINGVAILIKNDWLSVYLGQNSMAMIMI